MRCSGKVWLFDLDNTLHHASPHIFPHINRSMTEYIERHLGVGQLEATAIRQDYWVRYGATLLGLVRHHGTDPDHFLRETHQFPDLKRTGLGCCFDAVYSVESVRYQPKPMISGFRALLQAERLDPRRCIMVEDTLPNLVVAKKLGMKTVWVSAGYRRSPSVDARISSVLELPGRCGQL